MVGKTKIKSCTLLVGIIAFITWVSFNICKYRSLIHIALEDKLELDSKVQDQYVKTDKKYKKYEKYIPADVEDYIMNNFKELNYDEENDANNAKGCKIWESPEASNQENYDKLQGYVKDLEDYNKAVSNFKSPFPDVMDVMHERGSTLDGRSSVCEKLRLHPDGIEALFPSKQISLTSAGYVEPLLTPMRHHAFCKDGRKALMRMDYMVHDFESMCMKLKPKSRRVLIDMGASLSFHGNGKEVVPIVSLMNLYEKFGFNFDHIYAFEVTAQDPAAVYNKLLPKKYFPSYHWINTGVSADKNDKMNPLYSILDNFNEDDLVIVKLDIDISSIEVPLAKQLLEDDIVNKIVDHFYFEHHVNMAEIARDWGRFMEGSIQSSFELMNGLRKKGVASHFWV